MRCPSCGAFTSDAECCLECGKPLLVPTQLEEDIALGTDFIAEYDDPLPPQITEKSTLIEFPGASKNNLPEWRRELSERVREVQERRAREAALEAAEAERVRLEEEAAARQLELLPQIASRPLNPLVAAALRRIERANQRASTTPPRAQEPRARQAAVARVAEDSSPPVNKPTQTRLESPKIASGRKLVMVPPVENGKANTIASAKVTTSSSAKVTPTLSTKVTTTSKVEATTEIAKVSPPATAPVKRRLIGENDAALDYLAEVPNALRLEEIRERQAGILPRAIAALIDLMICGLLFVPFAGGIALTKGDWFETQTVAVALSFATLLTFLYQTFSTALAGRTVGMRLLSLRTVDRKTGLIPTGTQSIGRAVVFLASLFALGLPVLFALFRDDGQTAQDQLTGTCVVRA